MQEITNARNGEHTLDVIRAETMRATFQEMSIPEVIVKSLGMLGFHRPSPIQLQAIPKARMGLDLIIQAKSGTGKTCVFAVVALDLVLKHIGQENVAEDKNNHESTELVNTNPEISSSTAIAHQLPIRGEVKGPLALVIAPTREIAWQAGKVIEGLGSGIRNLTVRTCVGGISVKVDVDALHGNENVQIVIGTPGRIKHLVLSGALQVRDIELLVLDEADKLMHGDFHQDISKITTHLPKQRQTLVLSATFSANAVKRLGKIMVHPRFVKAMDGVDNKSNEDEIKSDVTKTHKLSHTDKHRSQFDAKALLGVAQYYYYYFDSKSAASSKNIVDDDHVSSSKFQAKRQAMLHVISTNSFNQCIIFCNLISEILSLVKSLNQRGWKVAYLCSHQSQHERFENIKMFKNKDVRVLVTTDLVARGIDVPSVTLVINMEIPFDPETYVHRVGRTGRFGTIGKAVTLVSKSETNAIKALEDIYSMKMEEMKSNNLCSTENQETNDKHVDPRPKEKLDKSIAVINSKEKENKETSVPLVFDKKTSAISNLVADEKACLYDQWIAEYLKEY